MAERKQVNKYYPPDWDPKKHGSVNKYQGSHPLRERARKLHLGILVIRFEMPYNIWCEGCNNHIGMGVRYNAEKSKTGNYYSTATHKFRFKCHLCENYIEMETDPQNLDYKILSGARRQERRWDPTENEQIVPDREVNAKMEADPMFRLEHGIEDKQKKDAASSVLERLETMQSRWKDDYNCNQILRKKFRTEKKELKAIDCEEKDLLKRNSLAITLLPEKAKDKKLASLMRFENTESSDQKRCAIRKQILTQPIFGSLDCKSKVSNIAKAVAAKKAEAATQKSFAKVDLGIIVKSKNHGSVCASASATLSGIVADYGESSDSDSNAIA